MTYQEKVEWIFEQHRSTNHLYDNYIPYEFHLKMVAQVAKDYQHLITQNDRTVAILAAYGHDLLEDTRISYNDVKKVLGEQVADIIYAVTNEKGKSRKERANYKYYEGIRNTPYATFVKLCDRIANVKYSKMFGSSQFDMYKKENESFIMALNWKPETEAAVCFTNLFKELNEHFR